VVDEFGRDVNLKPNHHHHQQYQPNHKQQRQPKTHRQAAKAPQKAHREEEEEQIKTEYRSEPIPVKKRSIVSKKPPLKLLEEGEVEE
jgi:hypothetical protein